MGFYQCKYDNLVAANIAAVFSSDTRIGSSPTEPRTTRLGLITYNSVAKLNADLNTFQSIDDVYNGVFTDLSAVTDATDSYLATGLQAANALFGAQSFNTTRDHYKKVVIVYASEYKGYGELDPVKVADEMKGSGVYIVTVAYDQGGNGQLLKDLAGIATPGYSFSNTDDSDNVIGEIQGALLQANCFCPNDWIQYRQFYSDTNSYRYGVCFKPVPLNTVWKAAKMSCANRWNNSYLVNEFNLSKHNFVLDIVNATVGFHQPFSYHIGGNKVGGVWKWDRPVGWEQPELKKMVQLGGWISNCVFYSKCDAESTNRTRIGNQMGKCSKFENCGELCL
ncbi:hypothetical protein B9Z55_003521 [Caenorhabditis nigoni]|uniref:VWFA domain-containing protein n=1 Tax=Caenorhabditis nigoni TaxID=1611254 RepID=A0A2G5VR84_9PELO|nr:hypothetical protein B9Z55_003521 [Caenorhabditis nigoni]